MLKPRLLEKAVRCGLRSLFVGFETLSPKSLREQRKHQNVHQDYRAAVRRLHDLGVMVNGSFVFGMDDDGGTAISRIVEWAIEQGIETATFHILTPYPGTALFKRMESQGRIVHRNWTLYDTRHVVFRPRGIGAEALEAGYWRAYRDFYRWGSILRGASHKETWTGRLRHVAYAGGWKKLEPMWDGASVRASLAGCCQSSRVFCRDYSKRAAPAKETISPADWNRSEGSLAIACRTSSSSAAGTSRPRDRNEGTGAKRCCWTRLPSTNGAWPRSSS